MKIPLISVLMSVYNGERFLNDAIASILGQTYEHFEFIIIDDSSSDKTPKILLEYSQNDDRIRVIHNRENIGLTRSLIKAADISKGEYLARQDADDISLPQRLKKQINFLEHNPSFGAVGTCAKVVDSEGEFIKNANVPTSWFMTKQILKFGNCFLHGSMMFKKEDYMKAGGYRSAFKVGQDFDLWLRISARKKIINLDERLYHWRDTGNNISIMKTEPQFKIGALALYDHRHNQSLKLDNDFDVDSFIKDLRAEERKKYDLCLRDLCLRHGNINMAKKYLGPGFTNNILITLAAIAFSVLRMSRR